MSLIGNYTVFNKLPIRWVSGGTAAGTNAAQTRANWNTPSDWFKFGLQDASGGTGSVVKVAAKPNGYYPQGAWAIPVTAGGMSSSQLIIGSGDSNNGNLAGGLNAEAPLSGSGTISTAAIVWLIQATATLIGAGSLSADIRGKLDAAAALLGSGDLNGAMVALVNAAAALLGSGSLTGNGVGTLSGAAALAGAGDLAGAIGGVINALSALTGSGTISTADFNALWRMVGPLSGSGDVSEADLRGVALMIAGLAGSGGASATPLGRGFMGSDITVTGELLTTANVGDAVWAILVDSGLTAQEAMKVLVALSAGKTSGFTGGASNVVFRDQADTQDVISATIDANGNRTSVIVDAS